jgi:uncharacterized protein YcaQ
MLWGDQVIGWANLSVLDGRLRAELGFVEGRPSGAAFQKALDLELARMASFLNLKEPVIE